MPVASSVRSRARSEGSERSSYPGSGGAVGAGLAGEAALAGGAALAAGAGFAVAVALSAGAVLVVVVAFVAGAVFVAVAGQLGDGPGPAGPAGWSGVQTCSAALVLT